MDFFPKWSRTFTEFNDSSKFRESDKSLKHELGSIYKDTVSLMCFASIVVASWSLIQEVVGLSPFNDTYILSLNSLNSVKTFMKNSIINL